MSKINHNIVFHVISTIIYIFENGFLHLKLETHCKGHDVLSYYLDSEIIMITCIMFKISFKNGSLKITEMSQHCADRIHPGIANVMS